MKSVLVLLTLFSVVCLWVLSLQQVGSAVPGGLPSITYLGEEGSYTIDPGLNFIVKRRPFAFDIVPGPSYTAATKERVWSTTASEAPSANYQTWVTLGEVSAGCVVDYQIIDDDPDERIIRFYVGDTAIYESPQGMVSTGSFMVESAGTLKVYAEDSVGIWAELCTSVVSPTPTSTLSPTATPTETSTSTATPTISATITATIEPLVTVSATPTISTTTTATATSSPTSTRDVSTRVITATPTTPPPTEPVELDTPTPTKEPRENACLRINFEVGGDEARRGLYVVQEVGGRVLYSWWAEASWMDSGWVTDIDITFPAVYVQVFYYRGDGSEPVEMRIVNPAPGTPYGWLARGQCHALEIAWPD